MNAVNACRLTDPKGKTDFWFILQDLSVRTKGSAGSQSGANGTILRLLGAFRYDMQLYRSGYGGLFAIRCSGIVLAVFRGIVRDPWNLLRLRWAQDWYSVMGNKEEMGKW